MTIRTTLVDFRGLPEERRDAGWWTTHRSLLWWFPTPYGQEQVIGDLLAVFAWRVEP